LEDGISYQTLIASILPKYVTGRLQETVPYSHEFQMQELEAGGQFFASLAPWRKDTAFDRFVFTNQRKKATPLCGIAFA
jgi:hypothetical protein